MQPSTPPEPWHSFLTELDAQLGEVIELHCIGGFVLTVLYGPQRSTSDVDFLSAVPACAMADLINLAGQGSRLHKKYGVYLHQVGIVTLPDDYESRLVEMFQATYRHLRLMAPDPYDLALSKLEGRRQHDRDDVKQLALTVPLEVQKLKLRYEEEMRPYLANIEREDRTLKLWIEMIEEVQQSASSASSSPSPPSS
jgi:hypothetical protein